MGSISERTAFHSLNGIATLRVVSAYKHFFSMQYEKNSLQTNDSTLQTKAVSLNEAKGKIISEVELLHLIFEDKSKLLIALHDMYICAVEQELELKEAITPAYLGLRYFLQKTELFVEQLRQFNHG